METSVRSVLNKINNSLKLGFYERTVIGLDFIDAKAPTLRRNNPYLQRPA